MTTSGADPMLLAMAAMSTDVGDRQHFLDLGGLSFGMFVFVALGWGLFWSAILSNALTAAVIAICCTGFEH